MRKKYASPGEKNPMFGKNQPDWVKKIVSKNSKKLKGIKRSRKTKHLLRISKLGENNPQFGKPNTESQKKKKRRTMIKKFKTDKEYVKKWKDGMNAKPNKCETKLLNILDSIFPNRFKFVGDFTFWIGGKNPDFIDTSTKVIVEHFGWPHLEENSGETKEVHENNRIDHFRNYGYKTIIVWEEELYNKNALIKRLIKEL
jgi:very-short-patch-repair endonuclease